MTWSFLKFNKNVLKCNKSVKLRKDTKMLFKQYFQISTKKNGLIMGIGKHVYGKHPNTTSCLMPYTMCSILVNSGARKYFLNSVLRFS